MSVHRCNTHGVNAKKIKRMLCTYEPNVTAQSLFAMLPPLVGDKQQSTLTTAGISCNTDSQPQSQTAAVAAVYTVASSSLSAAEDEAVGIVTESVESVNAADTDSACCSTELESCMPSTEELLCCSESHAGDVQLATDTGGISLDPAHSPDTQTPNRPHRDVSDRPHTETPDRSDTVLVTSATDEASAVESELSELDDKPGGHCHQHSTETTCEVTSACTHDKTLDHEETCSDTEHLKHLTDDGNVECLQSSSLCPGLADVKKDERFLDLTLHPDPAHAVVEQHLESQVDNIDRCTTAAEISRETVVKKGEESEVDNTDKHRTAEMSCETVSTDEQLPTEITEETSARLQSETHSLQSVDEGRVRNSETQCQDASTTAELIYWGQTDGSGRSVSEEDTGVVDIVASDTPASEQCISVTEPKPQRMRLHGCQKKPVSSLEESVLAGKEWMSECIRDWSAATSDHSSPPDREHRRNNVDENDVERCLVLCEYRTNSTQTESDDFITLTKLVSGDEVLDTVNYVAVVETTPRVISVSETNNHTSPRVPFRSQLHKSCSTADETESVDSSSQLDFLTSCFPSISSHDLEELLANCGNDIVVAADLLFEFGYEYNEPQDDVTDPCSSSTSCTDSTTSSPRQSVVDEASSTSSKVTRGRQNTSALYRLYRDSLIPKGVVLESQKMRPLCETVQVPVNRPASSLYKFVVFSSALLRIY